MDNFNLDENTVNKLKNMMNNGELSDIVSQIPPEMIQNFSSMMGQNSNTSNASNSSSATDSNTSSNSNFDFSNIDMNTLMKMKSIIDGMNSKNNPGVNLLNSLKPYLRDERKQKVDQYANLMNFAKVAELLNNNNNKHNKGNVNNE